MHRYGFCSIQNLKENGILYAIVCYRYCKHLSWRVNGSFMDIAQVILTVISQLTVFSVKLSLIYRKLMGGFV
jgi:hypothetical protein